MIITMLMLSVKNILLVDPMKLKGRKSLLIEEDREVGVKKNHEGSKKRRYHQIPRIDIVIKENREVIVTTDQGK